ncbi:hypothetical protein VE01_07024 [Pseudogymnoascus verrucosus]|uniref:Uncharacterized protein n=1 Tax=Pseudogymnoascus verrucosus TaxID=342668 RepID=A0A1B8GEB0_9PEZI|nr:uncharacterized protein VE01_07024 [Pseudogymnoascus verrucosus]OBT94153.2 hypothetical protein VE01_07024 [Pseudogymnoascus verrucosus]
MGMRSTCGNLSNPMMWIKMLSYWMTWEAASHIVFVCKQLLLDLQTEGEAIQEVLEVVIVALVTPVVVQEVVGLLDRATEGTELPLRKLPTYSDSRIHYQFSVGEEVADEAAIMAVLVQLTAILFMTTTPQKTTQRRPPQQRPVQRNSSPLLSLATPESFFPSAKRVENTQPQPTTTQPTKRQPATGQLPPKPPTTKQPASGQATARQPAVKSPVVKPPATKPPVTKTPATGQPTAGPVAPISKPNKPPHINSPAKVPKDIAPDNTRTIPSKDNDEDLIFCDLISLDNDGWVSTATSAEVIVEEPPSAYMQDMWTLEDSANAVFNIMVEVTMKGMAKERAVLVETIASGVVPDGRGMASSVYASDEPVTKESIKTYWETQGPSFRKGLENESICLILEGVAAEIVRRDAPTSSDLGQQDVSGSVSEYDQSNSDEAINQTEQAGTPGSVTGEPQGVSEPVENISGSPETAGDVKEPEITFVQYDASELLQLRSRALTVDKSAFPDEIRQFVVKDTNDTNVLLQKPKIIKVLGGLADSKWASPSKTNDENVAPSKTKAAPIKTNAAPLKTNTTPVKTNVASSKVNFDPSKASFVPSNTSRPSPTDSSASNFFSEKLLPTKATNGLADSKWADEPKTPDTYTPLDLVSAILSVTVPVRPKRPGLSDSMWADNPPSKGSLTRPSINKEVVDRMINPQLTHSSRDRRKKSIEIITEATKRRTAVLEKQAAEKEAAFANYPHY